jgi:hypothetical protein
MGRQALHCCLKRACGWRRWRAGACAAWCSAHDSPQSGASACQSVSPAHTQHRQGRQALQCCSKGHAAGEDGVLVHALLMQQRAQPPLLGACILRALRIRFGVPARTRRDSLFRHPSTLQDSTHRSWCRQVVVDACTSTKTARHAPRPQHTMHANMPPAFCWPASSPEAMRAKGALACVVLDDRGALSMHAAGEGARARLCRMSFSVAFSSMACTNTPRVRHSGQAASGSTWSRMARTLPRHRASGSGLGLSRVGEPLQLASHKSSFSLSDCHRQRCRRGDHTPLQACCSCNSCHTRAAVTCRRRSPCRSC